MSPAPASPPPPPVSSPPISDVRRSAFDVRRSAFGVRPLLPLLAVMVVALLALFEGEWRRGEVFSPADLVFQFYPWTHDAPKQSAANPTRSDEAFYHQPLMTTHFSRLREGQWPDLDDSRLSGVPAFFSGLDVGRAVSPFSLPWYLLPPEDAVNWYGPLRLLVAALAMWLLLRDLGVAPLAAAAGAMAYGLNGHFLTWLSAPMPTVAAWLPLVVRQVLRCGREPHWRHAAGLALAIGAMALGGYMATMLVCLFGAAAYGLADLIGRRETGSGSSEAGGGKRELGGERRNERRARAVMAMAGGGVLGLVVGAAALWPMLASLRGSPASARVVSAEGAPWTNLATLALPEFWGSPVGGTWWHPDPTASYPEHVAYLGVVVVLLAGLGALATLPRDLSRLRWVSVGLVVIGLTRAYGGYPGRWLLVLPGQAQSNPFRWYALVACALAVLAGLGLHAWLADDTRRRRLRSLAGPVLVAGALALVTAAALMAHLPDLRVRNLQAFERAQIARFAVLAGTSIVILALGAWLRDARARAACAFALVALAAADLVQAHRGFNPTVARDRYYPITRTLDWLREQASETRLAPVDTAADLIEGHVWGMYDLSTVTGFDFHGDADYQHFMRLAQTKPGIEVAPRAPVWDYVGLRHETLDLRMLGVLGARYIVAPPLDLTPRTGGYTPLGPIGQGRTVTLTVPVRFDGLRGIDLLTATYARVNAGRWLWRVALDDGRTVAEGVAPQATLRDNDWWRLTWEPVPASAGRRLTVTIRSEGAPDDQSATLLATASPSPIATTLDLDGTRDPRTVWFRTFSTAPERFEGATLVRSADLSVYRNPHARPRAWFVDRVSVAEPSTHASAMHTRPFDPGREAWVATPPSHAPTPTARVTAIALDDDRRAIDVDAPDGGVLILGERAHSGWSVTIDGRAAEWQPANGVLMAVAIPPGGRAVRLEFRQPFVRPALGVSFFAVAGIAFAILMDGRRPRR